MEVEVKQEERGAPEKRTADDEQKTVALGQEECAQQYRFPHFDVDPARWFFADVVSDGQAVYGNCYRDRATGRPMLLCLAPESHYTLYIQIRGDTPTGTAPMGFVVPLHADVGFEMQSFVAEAADLYADELGELQINAVEEVDEAEQARFLAQIRNGITLKKVEQELRAQLPLPEAQTVPEGRRIVTGRRRLHETK